MTVLIIVVLITIFISANCSLYEAVLYSTRIGTLESVKAETRKSNLAEQFIEMKMKISVPIAAILILNTVANTAGATIAGMYAADALGATLVPVFSIFFTLAILFLSEIAPKTIGAMYWRKLWPYVVWPLTLMRTVLYPMIIVTEKFTALFIKGHETPTMTEDEILAMVHLGAREGEITREESKMVRNIIHLEEKTAREIMTPRHIIFSLSVDTPLEEVCQIALENDFTRILVYENDRENIIGYVTVRDVCFLKNTNEPPLSVKSLVREISHFPETTNCLVLLNNFLNNRLHIAVITDEFYGVAGIVTLEDLTETILGREIVDELDTIVDLQKAVRKRKPGNK